MKKTLAISAGLCYTKKALKRAHKTNGGVAHLGAQTIKCATPLKSKFLKLNTMYGGVAHLGERLNGIQEVVGSIPIVSTIRQRLYAI